MLSSLALVEALYQDVRTDGFFDGQGGAGELLLPSGGFIADAGPTATALDGQTLRFALGQAIDRFIRSDRNQSGLTPNDVLPLIQQLTSNSDAQIFRSAGVNYDHDAPIVAFSAKFTRDGTTLHDPVGALSLVGGTVTITADVTDASTIQSATLSASGQPLTFTTTGAGTHLVLTGTITTTADGPLTITAPVADVHGNTAIRSYVLTVDNTPPTITVAPGTPTLSGYYSGPVPVDASASDANGVIAFTQSGFAGLSNLSGVGTRITGSWAIPANQPDGPVTLTLTATDSAFNVASLPVTINVDRTPPAVALVAPLPPLYTTSTSLTLHVTATDLGSGVGAVQASVNGAPPTTVTTSNGGTYDIPVNLGAEGNKQILIWAIDQAQPTPNSSFASAVAVNLTRDATNPAPVVQTGIGSYYDERPGYTTNGTYTPGMGLKLDSSGNPVVPPVYTFPSGAAKLAVTGAGNVYKAATRLSWGPTPPTVVQLYAQDGVSLNVPFIVYDVPVTNSEAPISPVANYTITCMSCTSRPVATGQLLHDPAFVADPQRFLLPLSAESVPFLLQLSGSAQLQVQVGFTDLAGNAGQVTIIFTFHIIGPPLVIVQDSAYPTANDPRSVFAYKTDSTRNYAELFDSANPNFSSTGVRVVRYVVQNPAPFPVALQPNLGTSTFAHVEGWNDVIQEAGDSTSPDAPGFYTSSACAGWIPSPPPCPTGTSFLYRGNIPATCTPPAQLPPDGSWANPAASVASGNLASATAYQSPTDTTPAASISGAPGYVLVPAASGTTPGRITVYVNRPLTVNRAIGIQLLDVMANSSASLGPNAYSYTVEDFWHQVGAPYQCCDTTDPYNPICYATGAIDYGLRRHAKYLALAQTNASGAISFTTQGMQPSATTLMGESTALVTSQPFAVSFTH